ncbi:MAG TPA: XdhC/CoxI family protein [Gemmatimonadales bacterium]|jgi:xanthine dehydrogenase accessory factor
MLNRAELWSRAAHLIEGGKRAALATVAKARGSLPMAHDAKMLVSADGDRLGTVGGGCTEADVTAQALATWDTKTPCFVKHTLNADLAGDIGLSCGGTVELFVEPLLPSDELVQLCRGVADAIDRRVAGTVTTGLDWTNGPRKVATAGNKTWQVGSALGPRPSVREFVEKLPRLPRLLVFGAGHVGAEIARVASRCDFHVVVVDDRADFANAERLPWAHEVVAEDFRTVIDRLAIDADDYIIAATRGHGHDALIVERTAGSAATYVGMLGSKRKQSVIWKALERAGVPADRLARVKVPIGEDIGADTPAEIAVAVVAELIRLRRGR